jgi:hypothetical protein
VLSRLLTTHAVRPSPVVGSVAAAEVKRRQGYWGGQALGSSCGGGGGWRGGRAWSVGLYTLLSSVPAQQRTQPAQTAARAATHVPPPRWCVAPAQTSLSCAPYPLGGARGRPQARRPRYWPDASEVCHSGGWHRQVPRLRWGSAPEWRCWLHTPYSEGRLACGPVCPGTTTRAYTAGLNVAETDAPMTAQAAATFST